MSIDNNELNLIISKFDTIEHRFDRLEDDIKEISTNIVTCESCDNKRKYCNQKSEIGLKKITAISTLIISISTILSLIFSKIFN